LTATCPTDTGASFHEDEAARLATHLTRVTRLRNEGDTPIPLLRLRDQLRTILLYPQIKYSGLFAIRICAENENF